MLKRYVHVCRFLTGKHDRMQKQQRSAKPGRSSVMLYHMWQITALLVSSASQPHSQAQTTSTEHYVPTQANCSCSTRLCMLQAVVHRALLAI